MSLELQTTETIEDPFAAVGPRLSDGEVDPICLVAEAHQATEEATRLFVAMDADPPDVDHRTVGLVEVTDIKHGKAHLEFQADLERASMSNLAHDPKLVRGVIRAIMERLKLKRVTINPESDDTNLQPSVIKEAGAVALSPTNLEFRLAA